MASGNPATCHHRLRRLLPRFVLAVFVAAVLLLVVFFLGAVRFFAIAVFPTARFFCFVGAFRLVAFLFPAARFV